MQSSILIPLMVMVLAPIARSGPPTYINSHGKLVLLQEAKDRIAVLPAPGQEKNFSTEAGHIRHPGGIWELPLAQKSKMQALIQRTVSIFSIPGSERVLLLDRQIIVKLRNPTKKPDDLLQTAGLELLSQLDRQGQMFLCSTTKGVATLDAARTATQLPAVLWALPDFVVPIEWYFQPRDPLYPEQWYHQQNSGAHIHSEEAWELTLGQSQVIVAVIDTGLDADHPDFAANRIVTGYDVPGSYPGPIDNDPTPAADALNAHGTCCAGLAVASIDNQEGMAGICPGCSLMGILMADAKDNAIEISQAIEAINYATQNGAWVISNSWGFIQEAIPVAEMQPLYDAIENAVNNGRNGLGSVVLFASGNGDDSGRAVAIGANELANLPSVMAVGGTDHTDTWVDYSNFGPNLSVVAPTAGTAPADPAILTTDTIASRGFSRDGEFWAPQQFGPDTNTGLPEPDASGNYTRYFNGTSAACPIAAGVVALVFSANPSLTGAEARLIVEQTAEKVGGVSYDGNGHNDYYGYGRVQAGRAVRAARIGMQNPDGSVCAENFNCSSNDCQKTLPGDFYGMCGGVDCSSLADGTACFDGDLCTDNDQCQQGSCSATAKDCNDGNDCTHDSCDSENGNCVFIFHADACEDGDLCTENDRCAQGICVGAVKDCTDGNDCTDDSCNPENAVCIHTPNTNVCNDGDACTIDDQCQMGICASTAMICADDNECTDDSCDAISGECLFIPHSGPCDDGLLCTENDHCDQGVCSVTAIVCADENPCTDDACDPDNGQCVFAPNTQSCDDDNPCTENDRCQSGACLAAEKDCDDGNDCTNDSCQMSDGSCQHLAHTGVCDDQDPCTLDDSCVDGACLGTAKDCSSLNSACNDGVCHPETGSCQAQTRADGKACQDDDPCTEMEICQEGECIAGVHVCGAEGGCSCSQSAARTSSWFCIFFLALLLGRRRC